MTPEQKIEARMRAAARREVGRARQDWRQAEHRPARGAGYRRERRDWTREGE